jgi:hypothetical protein
MGDFPANFGGERRLLLNFVAFQCGNSIFVAVRAVVTIVIELVIIRVAAVKSVTFDDLYQLFYLAREKS